MSKTGLQGLARGLQMRPIQSTIRLIGLAIERNRLHQSINLLAGTFLGYRNQETIFEVWIPLPQRHSSKDATSFGCLQACRNIPARLTNHKLLEKWTRRTPHPTRG